jgi:predicted nucleic acid-binding protein
MSRVFADTSYFLALLNPSDELHQRALQRTGELQDTIVTTEWVLTEVGNFLRSPENRPLFVALLNDLRDAPRAQIERASGDSFDKGVALYRERKDKEWSLTDCISFVVMRENRIKQALTGDHHFEQAGFVALLK